jgi:cytoskeletal protein CcmA (bactofilin family)
MSVFGSQSERFTPANPDRRAAAPPDLSFQMPPPPAAPAPRPDPAPSNSAPAKAVRKEMVLGKTLVFRGELAADEDLVLQGRVEGSIHHSQSLTIGVDGVVVGDIHAASITVEGRVEGNLYGSASVLIGASANVEGNVVAPKVGIREGAQFNGSVDMKKAAAASSATPRPAVSEGLNDRVVDKMLEGQ